MGILCGVALSLMILVDDSHGRLCNGTAYHWVRCLPCFGAGINLKMSLNSSHICFNHTRCGNQYYQGIILSISYWYCTLIKHGSLELSPIKQFVSEKPLSINVIVL